MKWLALHIGGQKWGVYLVAAGSKYLVSDGGDRCIGMCDYDKCRIYVSKAVDSSARDDALWHELMHALLHVTGAESAYGGDPEADEHIVSALTPAMHRLLRDLGFRFPKGTAE